MKIKRVIKWMASAILIVLLVWGTIVYWTSTNDCGQPVASAPAGLMRAVTYCEYGSPDVLKFEDVAKPVPDNDQVLVKVHAVSLNPLDWHYMEGTPRIGRIGFGLRKPKNRHLGVDYSGTIEAVGKNVTNFKPGDEVFGGKMGAFAQYVCARAERGIVLKPTKVTFEQAASVPIAGVTALQGLRDKGQLKAGQKVLINGASGGVGTFALQIAKSFGAEVTGVCSTHNLDMVRALGADHVIDYTKEDFTNGGEQYDLILDNVGNQPLRQFRHALKAKGTYVMIGGGGANDQGFIGPMARPFKAMVLSWFVSQKMGMLFAELNPADLGTLSELMSTGKLTPMIDKRYPFDELPAAMRYLEEGHARGKVVVDIVPE